MFRQVGEFETKINYIRNIAANQEKCGEMPWKSKPIFLTSKTLRYVDRLKIEGMRKIWLKL
jgi:hypothetical protein